MNLPYVLAEVLTSSRRHTWLRVFELNKKHSHLRILLLFILFSSSFSVDAQLWVTSNYPSNFQFRNNGGSLRDTFSVNRFFMQSWMHSGHFPSYLKWLNSPFAIRHSPLNGYGLFTDSVSSFSSGQVVGYAFFKLNTTGHFDLDYREANIGLYINDSDNPNVTLTKVAGGIQMTANTNIGPNTEITSSYQNLINLFPGDQDVVRVIQYW